MGTIENRLSDLGLVLPPPAPPPPGFTFSFAWARRSGTRVLLSGHGALAPDGRPLGPFGRIPSEVSLEAGQEAARGAAVAMIGSLRAVVGELDRVSAWLMAWGVVNADPGYPQTTNVMNGFSECIVSVFGAEIGTHARMAVGVSALPLNYCVLVGAEVEIAA